MVHCRQSCSIFKLCQGVVRFYKHKIVLELFYITKRNVKVHKCVNSSCILFVKESRLPNCLYRHFLKILSSAKWYTSCITNFFTCSSCFEPPIVKGDFMCTYTIFLLTGPPKKFDAFIATGYFNMGSYPTGLFKK